MSSGEEFEVEEILEQRKRKGILEYLVRWRGFNELYDSWEPATGLTDCAVAIKAFLSKRKKARSKSRSRSRGRTTKSRSRSRSRGRSTKSVSEAKQSPSRSSRKTTSKTTTKSTEVTVDKTDAKEDTTEERRVSRLRSRTKAAEAESSTSKSETVAVKESKSSEGKVLEEKVEVFKKSVETVKSAPVKSTESTTTMTTRSRLAVRQVENDQVAAKKSVPEKEKETWVWFVADHAVLILFILVSIIALSFTVESISEVRDKLVPDLSTLRQRLGESYNHFVEALNKGFSYLAAAAAPAWDSLKEALLLGGGGGQGGAADSKASPPPSAQAKA